MHRYMDLSYTLKNGMPTHPYDEHVSLYKNRFLENHKYNDSRIEMGMHVGTHIDVISHLVDKEIFISDYTPNKFIGRGCMLDVRNEEVIRMKEAYLDEVQEGDIVLLYTGYDEYFGTEEYFNNHPVIEKQLVKFLVGRKIKLIGIDLPSPDYYPFEVHKEFLENDILIIENMRNLKSLINETEFEVMAFPISIQAEASPTRVIAKVVDRP